MKRIVFGGLFSFGLLISCGGGGAPGSDDFTTVYLTTSIEKSAISVDVINRVEDEDTKTCKSYIPMDPQEQQNITFHVVKKPNLPVSTLPSDIVIYNLNLRLFPATINTEPFQECFAGVSTPTATYSIPPNSIQTVSITVINQGIKECLVTNYGQFPNICSSITFTFGPMYSVYATLSFTAREVFTGKEKTFEINLGTFNISDFTTSNTGGGQ